MIHSVSVVAANNNADLLHITFISYSFRYLNVSLFRTMKFYKKVNGKPIMELGMAVSDLTPWPITTA